jgi:penicillin-binding protein 1C
MVEAQLPDQFPPPENLSSGWKQTLQAQWHALKQLFTGESWHSLAERVQAMRSHASSRLHVSSPAMRDLKRMQLISLAAKVFLGLVIFGIVAFFGLFAWFSRDLPKPGQIVRREGFSTKIFDRNGVLLYDLFDTERRTPIVYSQLPDHLKKAVVAVEDKDFYKHQGFDVLTILRIPYNMVMRQRVVGGSTLTQQLVKNVLLTNERTLPRKFKELVLSIQIERTFSKDQILEMYLNEAPYGGTAWGVGTASEIYFNKKVQDLNLVESVILAGLPQRPSVYSPFSGKRDENDVPYWKVRAQGVLAAMRRDEYVTELVYQQALKDLDSVVFQKAGNDIKAPHFVFYVKDQLEKIYGEDLVEKGGLQVTTSLDLSIQEESQKIVAEEIDKVKDLNITNGSVVVMNPKNGEILAMVGSKDYFDTTIDGQFNVAANGLRQPGSSIKPVTYLGMFKLGYSPATMLTDVATSFTPNTIDKPYEPKNYDGKFHGPVNLRNSLGSSLNIPAVKSLAIVGVENFLQIAYDMGFYTLAPTPENMKRFGLAVTLGGGEVHLLDTVTAYSAFANGGTKVAPISVLKIVTKDGKTLFEEKPVAGKSVMTPEEAFLINNVLSDNNARLMAFGANSLLNTGKAIAVKTGTTNDQKDNWTIGWSQEIMVGTWVGNSNNSAMKRVASGVTGASPIWRRIILMTLDKGYKAPDWVVPAGVEKVLLDSISGYVEHDGFPAREEYVIKGTAPALPDPIHAKLKLCRGENKLATEAKIAAGDYDERESIILKENDPVSQDGTNRWQIGIDAWIGGQDDSRFKAPTEYCGSSSDVFVKLAKPSNETKYNETEIEVQIEADSGDGIEKVELWVDGSLRETINNHYYNGKVSLGAGQHELYAKAKSRGGKEVQSSVVKIGTGGQDWKKPEPTATPAPTAAPTSPAPTVVVPTTP